MPQEQPLLKRARHFFLGRNETEQMDHERSYTELKAAVNAITQQKIDELGKKYGHIKSIQTDLHAFQGELILKKADFLAKKYESEIGTVHEESDEFRGYLKDLFDRSELRQLIDSLELKEENEVTSITRKTADKVRKIDKAA